MARGLTLEALSEPIDKIADATPLARLSAAAATATGAPVVRREIERVIGRGRSGDDSALGITPRTKCVFETATKEAKQLGSRRCADSEHLLLALARSEGVAGDILAAHSVDEAGVREQLARLLEPEALEIAAKLRTPERRRGRRRGRG